MKDGISLELLREELNKVILQDLADSLDLSYGCLYAIREGRTKWPRKKTLDVLLPALDLKMVLIDAKS